jgi:hypothetical protein
VVAAAAPRVQEPAAVAAVLPVGMAAAPAEVVEVALPAVAVVAP